MTMRTLALILFIAYIAPAWGGVIPEAERKVLLHKTLSSWFWGQAKLSDGSLVQPIDESDRKTMPISAKTADQVLNVGEISGVAEWCGLDWQSNFLAMTAAARQSGLKQKQMAFIGVIHGLAQGMVLNALKSKTCGDKERAMALKMMSDFPNKKF